MVTFKISTSDQDHCKTITLGFRYLINFVGEHLSMIRCVTDSQPKMVFLFTFSLLLPKNMICTLWETYPVTPLRLIEHCIIIDYRYIIFPSASGYSQAELFLTLLIALPNPYRYAIFDQ